MSSHRLRLASALLLLASLTFGACGRSGDTAACDPADPRVRIGGAEGVWAASGVAPRLQEIWRAGGEADTSRLEFPASLAADATGRLAVADFETDRVLVFPVDGSNPVSWPTGHRLAKPVAVSWTEAGGLQIFDLGASRVLTTDAAGALLGEAAVPETMLENTMAAGGLDWAGVLPDGTVLFQPLPHVGDHAAAPGQGEWSIWRFPPATTVPDTLATAPARLFGYTIRARVPVPSWPRLRGASGSGGLLAIGGADAAYRIALIEPGGDTVRIVCRDTAPLPLSEGERGEVDTEVEAELLRDARPPRAAAFGHFFPGADGGLWVQRDRPFTLDADEITPVHGNAGGLFDVFAPDGAYLGEIRAPAGVRLRAAAGDRVWGLNRTTDGALELVAFRLLLDAPTP